MDRIAMLLLGLWGLTLLILWARRTGYLVSGALLQITLGASVALSVWGPPGLASTGIELRLFEGAQPLALAARALSPIVLLAILLTYVWGEQEEANTLLVSTTAVVVFVGIVLPLLFWVGQLLRSLLDPGVAVPEVARGPRSQIAQSAALIGGLYGQLVAYHFFGGRFGWGRPGVIGGGSFLMGGWLHAFLVATGTQFGTADWIPSLQAELWGWGTVTLFLWPLTMLALPWLSRGDVTRGDPRGQPLGQSLREVFSLQRALEESEHQLAGLNEKLRRLTAVRQGIARADREGDLARLVPEMLCESDEVRACWIGLTAGGRGLQAVARAGEGWEEIAASALDEDPPPSGDGLEGSPEANAEDLIGDWVESHPYHRDYLRVSPRAHRWFPLRAGMRLLGAMVVYAEGEKLSTEENYILGGAADDLAYGLHRLRLEATRAQRVRELTVIRQVMTEMISQPSVSRLLEVVTERAAELLDAEGGEIYLLDKPSQELERVAQYGRSLKSAERKRHEAIAARVAREGMPTVELRQGEAGNERTCGATISAPLTWQGRVTGVINVCRNGDHPFDGRELELLEIFANQAAIALENARLIETEREQSSQLERLRQASLSMTSSLELPAVLESILEQALLVVAAYDAHIFLYDGEELEFGAALWASGDHREPFSQPRDDGLTYRVARGAERIVIQDAGSHPLFEDATWQWDGAILGLPLIVGERVLGVMNVAFEHPREFEEEELHVLELLADQAAVILENARLFDRTAAERRRLRLLYDVARELSGSLDPRTILQRAVELTTANLGGSIGGVSLLDRETGEMTLAGLAGLPLERRDEINTLIDMRAGKGFVGWVAEQAELALAAEVATDPRWEPVPGFDDAVHSALAAPIFGGGELVGIMAVFHTGTGVFNEGHLELLTAICRQTGLAWSNAQRYRMVERRLAEQTALQQVAQVINRRLGMEPLLNEIVQQVSGVLGYPIVDIVLVEGDEFVLRAGTGLAIEGHTRLGVEEGVVGRVVATGKPQMVTDVGEDPDYVEFVPDVACEIAVPLHKGDVVVGVLNVEAFEPGALGEDDLRLLTLLADQVSVAVENAALYDRLQQHTAELEAVVSERTRELREALSRAQEADRLKTQFVSDVSHELRTPLSNIQLYVELLRQAVEERRAGYLETLERETNRLVALIEDLLSISRMDADNMPMEFKALDLNELSAALVEDRRRLFHNRGLDLIWAPNGDELIVEADRQLLSQVVANLMTNAMHYTPEGGKVRLTTDLSADGKWVKLTVLDTGLGIPEGELDKLFTRFFRGAASRQMGNPGTGLGLAICMEIAERHGGRISVESQEGEGSEFTVWLPHTPRP